QLRRRDPRMSLWATVDRPPKDDPQKSHQSGCDECRLPAITEHQNRHDSRGHDLPDIRAAIKYSSCDRAFFLREPLRGRLDGPWEVSRLTNAKGKPRRGKTQGALGQRMRRSH